MTEPFSKARNGGGQRRIGAVLLFAILALAAVLRLRGVDFGLPALNDGDEPLFMMTAFDMLRNGTLNPGWFGHPGTTTLYCLALIIVGVGAFGIATGRFAGAEGFAGAVYADPGIVFLPARLFIVVCGVACVYLTYRIGKRLQGERLGLAAAAFLAVNAVHIQYSQIIRTDMQASVFMLLCTLSAIAIARQGKPRAYVLAGIWAGLAAATKWPAALIAMGPVCASLWRMKDQPAEARLLLLFAFVAGATLVITSPYLLLDHQAVLRDLAGEARPRHPGATGGGFLANLGWYAAHPLLTSLGGAGLVLAILGMVWGPLRDRIWAAAIVPGAAAFLIVICVQALRWERWVIPLLPFLALGAAYALFALMDMAEARMGRRGRLAGILLPLLLMVPMLHAAEVRAVERAHDTRQIASAWIRAHAPQEATILVEDAPIDLLHDRRKLLFPLGAAGCLDAGDLLSGKIRYAEVEHARERAPVVDLGHVKPARLESCRAHYAILTHYDRYLAERTVFASELARYHAIMRGATTIRVIRPVPGKSSGPVVHLVRLDRTLP